MKLGSCVIGRMILRKKMPSNLVVVSSDFLENPYTKDGLNVVGETPQISTARPGQAPRASGKAAQDRRVSRCPTTSEAGPELLVFPVEISTQLVWFESFLCIKVIVQVRSSRSEIIDWKGGSLGLRKPQEA